jgi:hypothetical protein
VQNIHISDTIHDRPSTNLACPAHVTCQAQPFFKNHMPVYFASIDVLKSLQERLGKQHQMDKILQKKDSCANKALSPCGPRNIMKAYHIFNAYIYLEASDADTLEDNQHKHGLKPAKRLPEKLQQEMITVARRWT